ncbi:kinase-like protein [Clavulina sp. PMI_390]|nr:kinase-like protein [Clavulina sp. PMI_390]
MAAIQAINTVLLGQINTSPHLAPLCVIPELRLTSPHSCCSISPYSTRSESLLWAFPSTRCQTPASRVSDDAISYASSEISDSEESIDDDDGSISDVSLRFLERFGIGSKEELCQISHTRLGTIVDCLYTSLKNGHVPDQYSQTLRAIQEICMEFNVFPSSLDISVIELDRSHVVASGGQAVLYGGRLGGRTIVAREVVMAPRDWMSAHGRQTQACVHWEAIIQSLLSHDNILPIFGVYHDVDRHPVMILPFLERGSLEDLLDLGPLNLEDFKRIVSSISLLILAAPPVFLFIKARGATRAVVYLHQQYSPIIHGDLHPGNILIDQSGKPLLCDFGLSRIRYDVSVVTNQQGCGRIRFRAPELSRNPMRAANTTQATDIFSLSMTFFNMWTGLLPLSEITSERRALSSIRNGIRPRQPHDNAPLSPKLALSFWDLIEAMWAQRPSSRPPSGCVLEHLEHLFMKDQDSPPPLQAHRFLALKRATILPYQSTGGMGLSSY